MTDTIRTLSAIQTALADNSVGAITPQNVRDLAISVFPTVYAGNPNGVVTGVFQGQTVYDSTNNLFWVCKTAAGTVWIGQESVVNLGSALTGTVNIDLSTGSYFYGTLTGTTTFTVTNPPASGVVGSFTLELTNAGAQTITWTNGKWAGGTAATLTTAGVDILTGFTRDAGSTVRYALAEKDSK